MEQQRNGKTGNTGRRQIALVTGASSGIGREFVRQVAGRYPELDEIWAVARRKERLEQLKKQYRGVRPVLADLLEQEDRNRLAEQLKRENVSVRLLVNAAGCGFSGAFASQSQETAAEMIRLNCQALTAVTGLALPYMPQRSRILQVASASAFLPQPGFAVYAASKAYVRQFSLALGQELKGRKITVTAVCPGPVNTEFFQRAGQSVAGWKRAFLREAGPVVEKALRDAARGRRESIYGLSMNAVRLGSRWLPWGLLLNIMGKWSERGVTE